MTNSYNFDMIPDREKTGSVKWDYFQDDSVLPMWVADMDFQSPPAVIQALKQRVLHGVFGYTWQQQKLVDVVIDRLDRLYGWHVEKEWIVWLPGLVSTKLSATAACDQAASSILPSMDIGMFILVTSMVGMYTGTKSSAGVGI